MDGWELVSGAAGGIPDEWWLEALVSVLVAAGVAGLSWAFSWVPWLGGVCRVAAVLAVGWAVLTVALPLVVFGVVAGFLLVVEPGGSLAGVFVAGLAALGVSTRLVSAWVVNR